MLTNHELVRIVATIFSFVGLLLVRTIRDSIWRLLKFFVGSTLFVVSLMFAGYSFLILKIAESLGIWKSKYLLDTILLILTLVIPFAYQLNKPKFTTKLFRKFQKNFLRGSVLIGIYLGMSSFSIPVECLEFLFLVVVQFITLAYWYKHRENEDSQNRVLICAGMIVLVFMIFNFVHSIYRANSVDLLFEFLMLIWLPLAIYPFIHALAYYSHFSSIHSHACRRINNQKLKFDIGIAILFGLRGRIKYIRTFEEAYPNDFPQVNSYLETQKMLSGFRNSLKIARED